MSVDPAGAEGGAERPSRPQEDPDRPAAGTQVAVHPGGRLPAPLWRQRAAAVRSALPQLARNPLVVSASTVAAGVAVRLAVDIARHALAAPAPSAPAALAVTGRVVHHVHVHHYVHVLHHPAAHVVVRALPPPPRG